MELKWEFLVTEDEEKDIKFHDNLQKELDKTDGRIFFLKVLDQRFFYDIKDLTDDEAIHFVYKILAPQLGLPVEHYQNSDGETEPILTKQARFAFKF